MIPKSIYLQIHELRTLCVHECFVIDMLCRKAINMPDLFPEEIKDLTNWYAQQKSSAIMWCEYGERCLLNLIPGLIRGQNPSEPEGDEYENLVRLSGVGLPKLTDDSNEFSNILSLISVMCSLSVSAAFSGKKPDLEHLVQKLLIELWQVKEEYEIFSKGSGVITAGGVRKPTPRKPFKK
jgi:hypothetical protein